MRNLTALLIASAFASSGAYAQVGAVPPQAAGQSNSVSTPVSPAAAKSTASSASQNDMVRGLLIPDSETTLSSTVAAKITKLNVSIGSTFRAGQVLVSFDCDEPAARLNMATAELAGAMETHEAKIRMQGLGQAGDVEVAMAASTANKSRAQVDLQKAQVAQCTVAAPWSGRVAKMHVRNYMSVTPGQPLLDLVKSGPLKLRLNLPSRSLERIKNGTLFDVMIEETGKTYQAKIAKINSRVDAVSQTIEVEAVMTKNYPELLPGMSGNASFAVAR